MKTITETTTGRVSSKNINLFSTHRAKLHLANFPANLSDEIPERWPICVLPLHATPRFFLIVDKRQSIRRNVEHRSQGYKVMSP